MENKITPITARFASPETENAYQDFIFEGDWRNNFYVLLVGVSIWGLYIILDIMALAEWRQAAAIRGAAVFFGIALVLLAQSSQIRLLRETTPLIVSLAVGLALVAIIYLYTDLDDAYYVGLVQECVFVCFLLRMSFMKTVAALAFLVATFSIFVSMKAGAEGANLQVVVMLTMAMVCGIGSYLLQKFRRFDFQKTLIIDEQNQRLKLLLKDEQRDNERKLAAMNLLVHFVKTPLHQINGFSDIVMNSLTRGDKRISHDEGVEGARYIKTATANLSKSVNSLLTYHRLDESERRRRYAKVDIDRAFGDFSDLIAARIVVKVEGQAGEVFTVPAAVKCAVESLAAYYNETHNDATHVELMLGSAATGVCIVVRDNGRTISEEDFLEKTKPLTKIDSYLTSAGSEMPMLLRTTARAVDLCGGQFLRGEVAEGNQFVISLPSAKAAAAEVDKAVAA